MNGSVAEVNLGAVNNLYGTRMVDTFVKLIGYTI